MKLDPDQAGSCPRFIHRKTQCTRVGWEWRIRFFSFMFWFARTRVGRVILKQEGVLLPR